MAFVYRTRSNELYEKRANQSGSDFTHYIKDEYRLFTPSKGENCIRIMPASSLWPDPPHYGLDVWVHFSVGPDRRASVICLDRGAPQIGRSGEACPICQEKARAERAQDLDLARELRPTKRVLMAVLNRKDEPQGVLLWGAPYTLDQQIIKVSRDRSTGGWFLIDRPDDGRDVYFDKEGEGQLTKYTGVQLAQRSSPVADKHIEWVDQNPIPECLKWRDYEEVKRIFEGRGRGEDPNDFEPPPRGSDDRPPRPGNDRPPRGDAAESSARERTDDRRSERPPRDEPIRRPSGSAEAKPGNGSDDDPPFDAGPARPSSDPKKRAEELQAQFLSNRQK